MGGGPPSRIPPYIGVVDKKRGDNPVKEILGKIFWKVGPPPFLSRVYLCYMDYIITEEQFFDILNTVFEVSYPKLKTKKIGDMLFVYYGKSLVRYSRDNNNSYIMQFDFRWDALWIDSMVYIKIKRIFPSVIDNLLFYDFFKKWYSDKFGVTPKEVYITNMGNLNDLYNS